MLRQQHPTFPLGTRINDLEIVSILGEGAYGQVYLARTPDNRLKAIKSLRQVHLDERQRQFQRSEVGLHARLTGHSHIIRLERVIREAEWAHVVLEYGPEGDLFSAITERDLYVGQHDLIRHVFLQLIDAVSYCHSQGVYHRDLKPENILVFDQGHTVKLADFGLATTDPITTDYGCGSTFYFSPECQGDHARKKRRIGYATAPNDIWSLGVILINLATGRNPWRQASLSDDTFSAFLSDPNFLLKILPISRELNTIFKRIFTIDPLRRTGLDELRERIRRCKYFTRTPEVERMEQKADLTSFMMMLPPSPPRSQSKRRQHRQQQQRPQEQQQPQDISRQTSSSTSTSSSSSSSTCCATPDVAPPTPSASTLPPTDIKDANNLVPTMVALAV